MIWIVISSAESNMVETQLICSELESRKIEYRLMLLGNINYVSHNNVFSFFYEGQPVELPTICVNRMGVLGATHWMLTALMSALETSGVVCINNSSVIDDFGSKFKIAMALQRDDLPTPDFLIYRSVADVPIVASTFKFPIIVKTFYGSFGNGIVKCDTPDDLRNLGKFLNLSAYVPLVIQEFVDYKVGQDIRVLVIDNRIVGAMQRISPSSYKSNLTDSDAYAVPYDVDEKLIDVCNQLFSCKDLGIVGIDLLITPDGYKICEINISPGFKYFNKFCNRQFEKDIVDYLEKLHKEYNVYQINQRKPSTSRQTVTT